MCGARARATKKEREIRWDCFGFAGDDGGASVT